jgi:hypothetical protein
MGAVVVGEMSEQDARRLTERIRVTAHNYTEAKSKLIELVQEAKSGSAHLALGYASWTAYLADVLGEEPLRLARDERRELVAALSAEGMSTRAIAPIVGTNQATIARDISGDAFASPGPEPVVQGVDGKSYVRPERSVPPVPVPVAHPPVGGEGKVKRRPLPEQYLDALFDLRKTTERLERLTDDDRFARHRAELAATRRSDLSRYITSLNTILSKMSNEGTHNEH